MCKSLVLIFLLVSSIAFSQNFFTLRGYIYSDKNEPLPHATIRVFNLNTGTLSTMEGKYEIRLIEGLNRIIVSHLGYVSEQVEIVMQKDAVKNFILKIDQNQLNEVIVKNKKKDYSYEVIKQVLANKETILQQFKNYKCDTYIKSVEVFEPKHSIATDSTAKTDTIPRMNLFECKLIRHQTADGKQKEEKIAVKTVGNQRSLFFKSITDGEFNLYKNAQRIAKIGDNTYTSPLSDFTFLAYKFEILKYTIDGAEKVYKIKVIPRETGNALYEGEIEIIEDLWVLKSAKLKLNKRGLLLYDAFEFEQYFEPIGQKWMPTKTIYKWKVKEGNAKKIGETIVIQSNLEFDLALPNKFFGDEVGLTTENAYQRDSLFWQQIRPQPLTKNENAVVKEKERLELLRNSKSYLDSMDKIYNKITLPKIVYLGIGHINREKKTDWHFNPLLGIIHPFSIGGWRLNYGVSYAKRYENRKHISVSTNITYGFRNQDLRGGVNVHYLYNPKKLSDLNLQVGSNFNVINGAATLNDIIRRTNFYQSKMLLVGHRTELLNGLYVNTTAKYEKREDLSNFKFDPLADRLLTQNVVEAFPTTHVYKAEIGVQYTPRQLYLQEPNQKIILGSRYPTFELNLQKTFGTGRASQIASNFAYISATIKQNFNVGVFGISEYRIQTGKFLDTTQLAPMDYRYMRGGDPYFFSPSMYTYQLIPKTFTVFDWYFESHYIHQFNGYLTSKVPLLNKTGIKEVVGGGLLYIPERKYQYAEIFAGVNRIFKIGRERIRLGVYYVVGQSNTFGVRNGIKFSIEPYNQYRNTWSF